MNFILPLETLKNLDGFELIVTGDGSPSLQLIQGEAMHAREGAFEETLYIYGEALEATLSRISPRPQPLRFLSIGLGLGYVEIMLFARMAKFQTEVAPWSYEVYSFEKSKDLQREWLAWLHRSESQLASAYDYVAHKTCEHYGISIDAFWKQIETILFSKAYHLRDAMNLEALGAETLPRFHSIFFDAFSTKTTHELWGPEFLDVFLKNLAAPECIFSTYAVTGHLKRALAKENFEGIKRKGFGKKRESTLAWRS